MDWGRRRAAGQGGRGKWRVQCLSYEWRFLFVRPEDAYALRFAVADENGAVGIHKDPVRPGELAFERVAGGAIAARAGAGDEGNGAAFHINHADDMILGIGEIDIAVGRNGEAFRA